MIDIDDVQSIVLRPGRAPSVDIRFVRLGSAKEMRTFLACAASTVTTTRHANGMAQGRKLTGAQWSALNVGVTMQGLRLAGVDERVLAALPAAFAEGMHAAAGRLRDVGDSDPQHWDEPFDAGRTVHAVVLRYGDHDWRGLAPATTDVCWRGARIDGGKEPFGFGDGLSDPVIEGSGKPLKPGDGVWDPLRRQWRPVRTGEALMGYVDESGAVAGHPDTAYIERNGSYLVLRKLEQHVDRFEKACRDWGTCLGRSPDDIAAQFVGRQKDGTVVGQPSGSPPSNDFRYREPGVGGWGVPPSAHIRRANPRDDLEFADRIVARHLLFRRGYPYREDGPDGRVGLLFMACCADLRRQFEFIQSHWLQDGNRFGLGRETDPLVGQRQGPFEDAAVSIDHDGRRRRLPDMPAFVTTRGGEYFLVPSRSALALLGAGH